MNSGNGNGKKISSSSSSSSTILSRRPQYFRLDTSCQKKSEKLDCPAEYSYCFERKCQCWPEFQFWEDKEFSLSNAENNSAVSSLQLITNYCQLIDISKNMLHTTNATCRRKQMNENCFEIFQSHCLNVKYKRATMPNNNIDV